MKSPTKLSIREKASYGPSGASDFLIYIVPSNMMLPVYSLFLKVDAGLLGIVMAFPGLISVLAASLVGGYSDNLRSRYDRRRPLILIGGVTTALLLADVCDENELQTSLRREGACSSAATSGKARWSSLGHGASQTFMWPILNTENIFI